MSSLQKSMMRAHLPPCVPVAASGGNRRGRQKDYVPTMWDEHFEEKEDVTFGSNQTFRVYFSKRDKENQKPLLVLLHGGGYSALTWAHFTTEITAIINCQCLAIDLRGHGDTHVENESDLSANTLANDVGEIITKLYPDTSPPIMLIGHSMGGAICVHIASLYLIPSLIGCVVIDVVEGTAMEALASMQSFLRSRPKYFKSIQQAIEWSIRSGQIRNSASAKVSMPGQILNIQTGKLATNELPLPDAQDDTSSSNAPNSTSVFSHSTIAEDEEVENSNAPQPETQNHQASPSEKKYTWRIDLSKSEQYWAGWFENLSLKFLDLPVPKLLLLASIDGLDRALTVGQMQGKFQLQVLARCGHAVHEDRPHEVAEVIAGYMIRNKFAEASADFTKHSPCC
ncbi:protein phosphatase methylesterase 1 isoform X2 [Sitodiplosis mosellana]|uniref:protein phosphatase methylesterase 1 isoform X2 n=2 Tax=Sitodiplosis mosellana TaxID=263140 RepID=UPI0024452E6A|nr:protein phosphatase methylesterase 1 isoform X2 [Sitodiplosis mosellana]